MIGKLRSKPGGHAVHLTQASFEEYQLDRDFSLIFTSCNTLFDLPTQAAQLSCIRTAARHLRLGGCLAVEASVPFAALAVRVNDPVQFYVELLQGRQSRDRAPREGVIALACPPPAVDSPAGWPPAPCS